MNPFKIDILRRHYDAMMTKWTLKHSDLFTPEGVPHMGSGGAIQVLVFHKNGALTASFRCKNVFFTELPIELKAA